MIMETIGDGSGCGILILGIVFILAGITWSGTLSEDAQRRNYKRDKKGKE